MAELFEGCSSNLFRPLAAPGAPAVCPSLFVPLWPKPGDINTPLSRDLALSLVRGILSDPASWNAAAGASMASSKKRTAKAKVGADEPERIQAVATHCRAPSARHGWLRVETQSDFFTTVHPA